MGRGGSRLNELASSLRAIVCAISAARIFDLTLAWKSGVLLAALVAADPIAAFAGAAEQVWITDELDDALADPAQFQQPVTPRIEAPSSIPTNAVAQAASRQFWTSFGAAGPPSFAAAKASAVGASYVSGQEAAIRASTDMGDLLGGSAAVLDLGIQHRNPVVNDPRVRGSQVGSLAASGSYWVPARIDLDTMASKIDSRLVDHAIVIPGPYSALFGPGRQFVDFELKRTPRSAGGFETHGSSSADYRTNGEQWYGRQSFWGGDDVWGFRAGYGHRTGNDYASGDGRLIPGSYKSRDLDVALGAQITPDSAIEGQALRLDQTDVELAGQAFDIDWLVTDGYEVQYVLDAPSWADRLTLDAWYNRTRFEGSAQRPSKRKQFPIYDLLEFQGFTDVDSMSTGYRLMSHWDGAEDERLDAGADFRYVRQELNEFTSGRQGLFAIWNNANSPIPRSDYVNPGLFVEASAPATEIVTATVGGRIDYVGTQVLEDPANLAALGIQSQLGPDLSAADIWGSGDLQQNELLGLGYLSLDAQLDDGWAAGAKIGYSERAPNLTERYAVETFMALLQNGLNTVTGDPHLDKEKALQCDLRLARNVGDFHGQVVLYHAWVHDYITYEALSVVPPAVDPLTEQTNLKYVNTNLATLWGCEARAEYDWNELLTPFATLKYVQGTDRTRRGDFATQQAVAGNPSVQIEGAARGSLSGLAGADKEPLPSILPLESRLGLRWEEKRRPLRWGVELSTRMVDAQHRVAASLRESTTAGFTTWDLQTFVRPSESWQLVAGVENFTDKQYREHLDFRSRNPAALSSFRPGVNFYFGTELKY